MWLCHQRIITVWSRCVCLLDGYWPFRSSPSCILNLWLHLVLDHIEIKWNLLSREKKKKTKSTVYNCWTNAVFGAQLEQLHFIGHILFCVIILYIRYVYLSSLLGPFFIYSPCQTPSHLRTKKRSKCFNYSRFLTPLSIPTCLSVFFKFSRSEISSNESPRKQNSLDLYFGI